MKNNPNNQLDTKRLQEIHQKILDFNNARGWDPKFPDLAKSIVIEAAELLELFQWQSSIVDSKDFSSEQKQKIRHEVADVVWYIFLFCQKTNIDLVEALEEKYQHNSQKYPAEKFNGHDNSEFYYQQKQKYREHKK